LRGAYEIWIAGVLLLIMARKTHQQEASPENSPVSAENYIAKINAMNKHVKHYGGEHGIK